MPDGRVVVVRWGIQEPRQDLSAGLDVVGRLVRLLEDRHCLAARSAADEQLRRQGARRRVAGRVGEHRAQRCDGVLRAPRPRQEHLRDLELDGHPRGPCRPLSSRAQRPEGIVRLAQGQRDPGDRRQRLVALRVDGQHPAVQGERPGGVPEHRLLLTRPLQEAQRAFRLGRVLGAPLEQPASIGAAPRGVPLLGHEGLEGRERRGLRRRVDTHVGEHVAVRPGGLLDPCGVAPDHPGPGQQQRRAVPGLSPGGAEPREGPVDGLLERFDRPCCHGQALERRQHVLPRGRELEGPLGLPGRAPNVAQPHLEHLGGAQRQRHPLGVVGALVRDRGVEPWQVGPVAGPLRERGEANVDLDVLGRHLASLPVQTPRGVIVPRLVRELGRPLPRSRRGLEVPSALRIEVP